MYNIGTIFSAQNLPDAIGALVNDPQALLLAGGTSLLVNIRVGKDTGRNLISLSEIPELAGIERQEDGTIVIGACTTLCEIATHPLIQEHLPLLATAAKLVAGPQTRNLATIGGNVCTGYMSADTAIALLALNAQMELTGPSGVRKIALANFYRAPTRVDLAPGEILTAIRIAKADYTGFGGHFEKEAARRSLDFAILNCAALVKLNPDGETVAELRLSYGVAAPKPLRCGKAEALAIGRRADAELIQAVVQQAVLEAKPCKSCWRASRERRLYLIRQLGMCALEQAITKAKGAVIC